MNVGSTIKIKMNSKTNGDLMINLPNYNSNDDNITIVGVGILGENLVDVVNFEPITSNFTKSNSDLGFLCEGNLTAGQNASFRITYEEPPFSRWDNTIILRYKIGTENDILEDYVTVAASTPITELGGDIIADISDEVSNEVNNPRTYALSFKNSNKSKKSIAKVELRMPKNVNLLAIGSELSDTLKLQTMAKISNKGEKLSNYLAVNEQYEDNIIRIKQDLELDDNIKPIFFTVNGGNGALDITYTTYDNDDNILTESSVSLLTPLTVDRDINSESMIMNIYPNPAQNQINLNLNMMKEEMVNIIISDINGKELINVINQSKMSFGDNILNVDVSNLMTGTYVITAKSISGKTISNKLIINK